MSTALYAADPRAAMDEFRQITASLFPTSSAAPQLVVPRQKQLDELNSLNRTISHERFFCVFNLLEAKLEHVTGFGQWLGYIDEQFQIRDYFRIIHKTSLSSLSLMAKTALLVTQAENFQLEFCRNRLIVLIGLQHRNGTYLLCKRTLSPWQYDTHRRVTAWLNEYSIVKEYDNEPLTPRVLASNGIRVEALEKALRTGIYTTLERLPANQRPFTLTELRIARFVAYQANSSSNDLASEFDITLNTVESHSRNLRAKAAQLFGQPFSLREAAAFMRQQGIV
ncbi:hypothetical protein [Fibrella forsythiae]|uniref:HTH luxR-type domain-containing protein n=1 Tax=Fibrella forsythiae TaxID=2817061 RepID=A0ABS3JHV6_9BACT|nr:hypothetical protein [Fibrella forsythiae]MBO0948988.1 hypothetical protein [Fibrella forsythiae]